NAEVQGLKEFPPSDRPPVMLTFISFRIMMTLGFYFLILTLAAWVWRKTITENRLLLKMFVYSIPLPYIATQMGWMLAEVGRQPWVVYGVMRTSDAVSPIAASQVGISLAAFVVLYTLLGLAAFYLIASHARKGPQTEPASTGTLEEVKYA
ncbi:MAG: cytochrome ubiquinol oxidase subunit I, partial [Syntrophobacteraceae bacterium]